MHASGALRHAHGRKPRTLVRIMAAPSEMRRSASPRSRQPHTNGALKLCLLMWCASSAGVSTCDAKHACAT